MRRTNGRSICDVTSFWVGTYLQKLVFDPRASNSRILHECQVPVWKKIYMKQKRRPGVKHGELHLLPAGVLWWCLTDTSLKCFTMVMNFLLDRVQYICWKQKIQFQTVVRNKKKKQWTGVSSFVCGWPDGQRHPWWQNLHWDTSYVLHVRGLQRRTTIVCR